MKTTLLIGTKVNTVTLVIEPENGTEREVFAELQRRQVTWLVVGRDETAKGKGERDGETAKGETVRGDAPAADAAKLREVLELIRKILPLLTPPFHYRDIREHLNAHFPEYAWKFRTGIYPGVAVLIQNGEIIRIAGGFGLAKPGSESGSAPVMTAGAETVAQ